MRKKRGLHGRMEGCREEEGCREKGGGVAARRKKRGLQEEGRAAGRMKGFIDICVQIIF